MSTFAKTVFEKPEIRQQQAQAKKAADAEKARQEQQQISSISSSIPDDFDAAAKFFADRFVERSTFPQEVAAMRQKHGEDCVKAALRMAEPDKMSFAMRPENLEMVGFSPAEFAFK